MSFQNGANGADQYSQNLDVDVLVVGAGFSGCCMLHTLRKQGLSVKIYEAGKGMGGTWYWNRYPGARVDCELPWYGYSDPEIWNSWTWTERFPDHNKLRSYFQHVDKIWNISKDVAFDTTVVEARFQNDGRWLVKTADGRQCRCTWFIPCTGPSFKTHIPDWKGMDKFKGQMYHSSRWPQEGINLTGKRIAVIGAGSTGIQATETAAKEAAHVTQFVRTPGLTIPMRQRKITDEEILQQKPTIPFIFEASRSTFGGLPMHMNGKKVFDDPPEVREAVWEEAYKRGGFNFWFGAYVDELFDKAAAREKYNFWAKKTRARISDPKKRDILAPLEAPYFYGTKRASLEQDYYEQIDKPHVEIENSPILEFQEEGIVTEGKLHKFDVIALATGYDALSGALLSMGIKDKDGVDLCEKWKDGVTTNLGMTVHGYPNMIIIYGPQAPTSFTNCPVFIEIQCEWVAQAISKMREENIATMETKKEAEEAWKSTCLHIADMTLFPLTKSWYNGSNVPGKKQEFMVYLGGIPAWRQACKEALEGWRDFNVVKAST